MKKYFGLFGFLFLLSFGIALAFSQPGTELLTYNGLRSALSDGTLVTVNANNCTTTGYGVPNQTYLKNCLKTKSVCFSGAPTPFMPPYSAILACAATATPAANPTQVPTTAPTATPIPHTAGLAITDGCLTNNANYSTLSGYSIAPAYEAVANVSGSTCSSGNILYTGGMQQALNHGANVNIGTVVTVGADLYGTATSGTIGTTAGGCTQGSGTATGTASIELRNSSGTVEASANVAGNNAWAVTKPASFTIPATGVYYIVAIAVQGSKTISGSIEDSKGTGDNQTFYCNPVSRTLTANGYVTGLSVTSS